MVWALLGGGFLVDRVDFLVGSLVELGREGIITMEVIKRGQRRGMEMNLEALTVGIVGLQVSILPQTRI